MTCIIHIQGGARPEQRKPFLQQNEKENTSIIVDYENYIAIQYQFYTIYLALTLWDVHYRDGYSSYNIANKIARLIRPYPADDGETN